MIEAGIAKEPLLNEQTESAAVEIVGTDRLRLNFLVLGFEMKAEPVIGDVVVVVLVYAVVRGDREMREEIVVEYHLQESPSKHKIEN